MKRNSLVLPKNLNRQNMPYMITWIVYYAWVIVFTTWWTTSPASDNMVSEKSRTIIHSLNLLFSALFVVIIPKIKFARYAYIGAAGVVISAVAFLLLKNATAIIVAIIFLSLFLGLVNACILIPFVFVLNNSEKFWSVLLSNALIAVLMIFQETNVLNITNGVVPSLLILIAGLVPVAFFRTKRLVFSEESGNGKRPAMHSSVYLTLLLNCFFAIFCKGLGKTFVLSLSSDFSPHLNAIYYAGGLIGCLAYFLIFAFFKKHANEISWNVTFVLFVLTMIIYLLGGSVAAAAIAFSALIGVASTIGMINMYYILGVIGKKYNSQRYVRISVVVIGVVGGVTGTLSGNLISAYPESVAISLAVAATFVAVLLLAFSPVFARTYFSDKWSDDCVKPEVDTSEAHASAARTADSNSPVIVSSAIESPAIVSSAIESPVISRARVFDKFGLSPREREVCALLLKGLTLRQIAGELKLSYATVNTYHTSLYRKLGVNSKIELVLLIGGYRTDD